MAHTAERTAVLIVRAWVEPAHPHPLRATITRTLDIAAGEEVSEAVDTVDAVCEVVREWLEEFLEDR